MVDSKEKYKFDLGVKGLIITDLSIFHSFHCFFLLLRDDQFN